jgi:hypothetical protein
MHGWPQNHREFLPVIDGLTDRYTFIAPDLRGYADSEKPVDGYDPLTIAADMLALLDVEGVDKRSATVHHAHAQPGSLRGSLNHYGAIPQMAAQAAELTKTPLSVPMLAWGGRASFGEHCFASAKAIAVSAEGASSRSAGTGSSKNSQSSSARTSCGSGRSTANEANALHSSGQERTPIGGRCRRELAPHRGGKTLRTGEPALVGDVGDAQVRFHQHFACLLKATTHQPAMRRLSGAVAKEVGEMRR